MTYSSDTEFNLYEERHTFSVIGAAFALLIAVTFAVQVLFIAVFWLFKIDTGGWSMGARMVFSVLPMYAGAVPVTIAVMKTLPSRYKPADQKWKPGWLVMVFTICISTMYIGNIIGQVIMAVFQNGLQKSMDNELNELVINTNLWVTFLTVAVAAPLIEELLFRKLLIDRINRYGQGVSILVSGLMFGLIHGNFYQFFYAFGLGVIFAYVYVKTGRVRYTIAYHMIINFLGSVLAVWMLKLTETLEPAALGTGGGKAAIGFGILGLYGLGILTCFVTGIVLAICYRKQFLLYPGLIRIPRGLRFKTVILNAGMIVFLLLSIVQFLLPMVM